MLTLRGKARADDKADAAERVGGGARQEKFGKAWLSGTIALR